MSIRVIVGILVNDQNQVLIARRPLHVDHGGFWEFPGGKIEDLETPYNALVREINEEVGLQVLDAQYLTEINHDYKCKQVTLLVYRVLSFQGIPRCRENQIDLRWVNLSDLSAYSFPEANQAIINLICN